MFVYIYIYLCIYLLAIVTFSDDFHISLFKTFVRFYLWYPDEFSTECSAVIVRVALASLRHQNSSSFRLSLEIIRVRISRIPICSCLAILDLIRPQPFVLLRPFSATIRIPFSQHCGSQFPSFFQDFQDITSIASRGKTEYHYRV